MYVYYVLRLWKKNPLFLLACYAEWTCISQMIIVKRRNVHLQCLLLLYMAKSSTVWKRSVRLHPHNCHVHRVLSPLPFFPIWLRCGDDEEGKKRKSILERLKRKSPALSFLPVLSLEILPPPLYSSTYLHTYILFLYSVIIPKPVSLFSLLPFSLHFLSLSLFPEVSCT